MRLTPYRLWFSYSGFRDIGITYREGVSGTSSLVASDIYGGWLQVVRVSAAGTCVEMNSSCCQSDSVPGWCLGSANHCVPCPSGEKHVMQKTSLKERQKPWDSIVA